MEKEYKFSSGEIEAQIAHLSEKGITEFCIHDEKISRDKKRILKILTLANQYAPEVFVSILADVSVIDREVVSKASEVFCSFDIPFNCSEKGGKILFDKKLYSSKARLLNDFGMVFGFQLTYGQVNGDSLKAFMDRLDFAVSQYPNHIDFPQTEKSELNNLENDQNAKVTGLFSAKDIRYCRDVAFACRTFYSSGRAVPWMLSVLKPLKIYPSKFFADFAEWQRCNNCDFKSGFIPEAENHKAIEKMQLLYLDDKFEEKHCADLIPLVHDVVAINGAMSRLAGENEESIIETVYNPDDLFGPEVLDLASFFDNVCMENSRVRIYAGEEGPEYSILSN